MVLLVAGQESVRGVMCDAVSNRLPRIVVSHP